jgi:uridine kinase
MSENQAQPHPPQGIEPDQDKERIDESTLLTRLAERLRAIEGEETKVIALIGGAASGKSTLARKLAETLGSADTISTDDYVVGDRAYRRQHLEGGDPTLKYDSAFLNRKIQEIISLQEGETVAVPTYDESSGASIAVGEENFNHQIKKIDYLIVEGDFNFVENPDVTIYFDVDDNTRLENRLKRDQETRSETDSQNIIDSFNLRHELQHLPHTLPVKESADILITASLDDKDGEYRYSTKGL